METRTGMAQNDYTVPMADVLTPMTVGDRLDRLEKQVKAILGVMRWMDLKAKSEPEVQKALKALKDCLE